MAQSSILAMPEELSEYSLKDWREDTHAASQGTLDPVIRTKGMGKWALEYFSGKYANPAEAAHKRLRLSRAMTWFEANEDRFDSGSLSVKGQEKRLLGIAMVDAMWCLFAGIPDESLTLDPPWEIVDQVIRESVESEKQHRDRQRQKPS